MYTLYWSPGSASMAPHAALEEIGAKYELKTIDLSTGKQRDPEYLKLNPNGKVPTLVVDGRQVMFESAAITMYLADRHPEAGLSPAAADSARGHYYQWMTHLTNTLQPAMLRFYYPDRITNDPEGAVGIAERARDDIVDIWGRIDQHLKSVGPYFLGDRFSAADLFAFTLSTWQDCCPGTYDRFPHVKRLADLVAARPAIGRVIKQNEMSWPLHAIS